MAWETRGKNRKHRYFYRSERMASGRIKKTYLGNGQTAERVAQRDADVRSQREADQEQARQADAVLAPPRGLTRELDEAIRLLTAATLLAGNLHQHKGQWRARRGK